MLEDRIIVKLSSEKTQIELREKLFSTVSDFQELRLTLQIQKLEDEYGNRFEERKFEDLYQFREFFTQEVKIKDVSKPFEKKLVLKRKPLKHTDQPITKQVNVNEYWMNTPLQKIKE